MLFWDMFLIQLFEDKSLKSKQRTEQLAKMLAEQQLSIAEIIQFANAAKEPARATCIEGIEFVTQSMPDIINGNELNWIIGQLGAKAPRIKWEAAKVVGNTIHLHPGKAGNAVKKLLDNTESAGTVVRWSAAIALSQVLKMKTNINTTLIPAIEAILGTETQNSIKKIYLAALKKAR